MKLLVCAQATPLAGRAKKRKKTKRKKTKRRLAGEGEGDRGQWNAKRKKDIGVYIEKRCCAVDRATVDLVS